MNKALKICRVVFFSSFLLAILLLQTGCTGLGETRAEARRRHMRVLKVTGKQIGDDMDLIFMMDKPSTLTEKLIR